MNQIALYLANSTSCRHTFSGIDLTQNFSFTKGNGIRNRQNEVVYAVGNKYAQERVELTQITISPTDEISPPNDLFGVLKVSFTLEKLSGQQNTLTSQNITKKVVVQVLANVIASAMNPCFLLELNLANKTWEALGTKISVNVRILV